MTLFETTDIKSPPPAPKKARPYKRFVGNQPRPSVYRSLEADMNAVAPPAPTTPAFNPAPAQ